MANARADAEARNESFFRQAAGVVKAVYEAVTRDGTVEAAGRQGIKELGAALKAFPDTIQVHEPGTVFSPTQGEIADRREPSPGDIASDNTPSQTEQSHGHERGRA